MRDRDGQPLPEGESGELWVRGPTTFAGYWRRPELTGPSVHGRPGCVPGTGSASSMARVYHEGRLDDLVKLGGIWVAPTEIEDVLRGHPDVSDAAVVATDDGSGIPVLRAYVVSERGGRDLSKDLLRLSRTRLANYKVPQSFSDRRRTATDPFGQASPLRASRAGLDRRDIGVAVRVLRRRGPLADVDAGAAQRCRRVRMGVVGSGMSRVSIVDTSGCLVALRPAGALAHDPGSTRQTDGGRLDPRVPALRWSFGHRTSPGRCQGDIVPLHQRRRKERRRRCAAARPRAREHGGVSRILIVGGGYIGMYAARGLERRLRGRDHELRSSTRTTSCRTSRSCPRSRAG